MRYRISIDFPGWQVELDAENPDEAVKEATALLQDRLEDLLLEATITVEAVDTAEEDRGGEED